MLRNKKNSQSFSNTAESQLCVGELKSAYGIKGWLWVFSYTDPIEKVFEYAPWQAKLASQTASLKIESWRKQGKGLVVKLADVDDRTAAETYCHTKLYIDANDLPPPEEDEFYWSELIGMQVISETGNILGQVAQLSETPAHQMLEVEATAESADNQSRLIPWHETVVLDVNRNTKVITVAWELDY